VPVSATLGLHLSSFFAVGLLAAAGVVEQIDWMTMSGQLHVITANFVEEMAHDTVIHKCLCQFLKTEINTLFCY